VIAVRKITTALAAGCTVVCKPSPETPITTTAFAKLCTEVGYADGVVNVITASLETTPEIGQKLCEDPRIKKVSFTGSTRVSALAFTVLRIITVYRWESYSCSNARLPSRSLPWSWAGMARSSCSKMRTWKRRPRVRLFGQGAPSGQLTNLALTANKFRALGQVCMCANRVFVHKSVVNKFVRMMKEKISELKFGHGLEPGT
jgi:succinate-semialdehyde dehydrogenase/glutarate-semialdehyde dehydrogenase